MFSYYRLKLFDIKTFLNEIKIMFNDEFSRKIMFKPSINPIIKLKIILLKNTLSKMYIIELLNPCTLAIVFKNN